MGRYGTRSITKAGNRAGVVSRLSPISSIIRDGHNANLVTKNRMILVRLKQLGILAPGVLTIDAMSELRADVSREEPDSDSSWLRDYLVDELDVYGCGPPAVCAALYDHLKKSQNDVGINTSVRTAETLLRCAVTSLKHAIQDVQEFMDATCMVADTYDLEVGMVIWMVKRLVVSASAGCDDDDDDDDDDKGKRTILPKDTQLLLDIGRMGVAMKSAMETSLKELIADPYSGLVEKLDMVATGLRKECERQQEQAKGGKSENEFASDSGIDGC